MTKEQNLQSRKIKLYFLKTVNYDSKKNRIQQLLTEINKEVPFCFDRKQMRNSIIQKFSSIYSFFDTNNLLPNPILLRLDSTQTKRRKFAKLEKRIKVFENN